AEAGRYTAGTLDSLHECGSIGALVWCYAEYAAQLQYHPPLDLADHEWTFGLWRADGTPNPPSPRSAPGVADHA
ncbi:MAG TPA: hypothetical protein VFH70_01820, partial [Acidimicrobiales bacterium]|nr:hypothetical protein [Acidimicrobiales bacterium]